jgi:TRAP-type C4-dicarboxylate transport system permease small subunit
VARICRAVFWIDDLVLKAALVACGFILIVMVGVATFGIVSRFVFNASLAWSEELDAYLFIWLTCLGAGAGIRLRAHPEVRIAVDRLPAPIQKGLGIVADTIVLVLGVILLVHGGDMITLMGTETASSLPISMTWPYLAIPIGGAMLILHSAAHALAAFYPSARPGRHAGIPERLSEAA